MIDTHPHIPLLTTSLKWHEFFIIFLEIILKGGGEEWYVGVAATHFSIQELVVVEVYRMKSM